MAVVVDCRAAGIHADLVVLDRPKFFDLSGKGVEQAQGHSEKRTSILGGVWRTGQTRENVWKTTWCTGAKRGGQLRNQQRRPSCTTLFLQEFSMRVASLFACLLLLRISA